ncbi:MAG: lysoplasmalogenase family protein, partial [bacterium]|nr:lysoplasmalogenase family protein [bacterium]
VLGTMVVLALATGSARPAPALVLGALLVVGSDLAVARERFVTAGFVNKAVGLPTYYLGQTLVALALVGP